MRAWYISHELLRREKPRPQRVLQLIDSGFYQLHLTPRRIGRLLGSERKHEQCQGDDDECGSLHEAPLAGYEDAQKMRLRRPGMIPQ